MARLRAAAAALAVVGGVGGAIAVGGFAVVGCGDTSPSGTVEDGAADQTSEGGGGPDVTAEAHRDVGTTPDMGTARETGGDVTLDTQMGTDGRSDADAAGDVNARETGADADAAPASDGDAGVDTGSDAAADADAADVKVIPPGLLAYPQQYATAICTGLAACCGATFDVARCEVAFATQGYAATLPQNPTTFNSGNLTFNATQAAACTAALQAWPCGAMITSAQNNAIITACHGVLGGTIPVGGTGCISSFECLNGYCNAGTCTALVANGGACTPGNPSESSSIDYQCSQIGAALPAPLICDLYPANGSASSGTGSCVPPKPDGVTSLCSDGVTYFSDYACTNGLCNDTSMCGPTATNPTTSFGYCAAYVLDAGGG